MRSVCAARAEAEAHSGLLVAMVERNQQTSKGTTTVCPSHKQSQLGDTERIAAWVA